MAMSAASSPAQGAVVGGRRVVGLRRDRRLRVVRVGEVGARGSRDGGLVRIARGLEQAHEVCRPSRNGPDDRASPLILEGGRGPVERQVDRVDGQARQGRHDAGRQHGVRLRRLGAVLAHQAPHAMRRVCNVARGEHRLPVGHVVRGLEDELGVGLSLERNTDRDGEVGQIRIPRGVERPERVGARRDMPGRDRRDHLGREGRRQTGRRGDADDDGPTAGQRVDDPHVVVGVDRRGGLLQEGHDLLVARPEPHDRDHRRVLARVTDGYPVGLRGGRLVARVAGRDGLHVDAACGDGKGKCHLLVRKSRPTRGVAAPEHRRGPAIAAARPDAEVGVARLGAHVRESNAPAASGRQGRHAPRIFGERVRQVAQPCDTSAPERREPCERRDHQAAAHRAARGAPHGPEDTRARHGVVGRTTRTTRG